MEQDSILHMRVSNSDKRLLDDLRKIEPDLPSKSEMVRRLMHRAHASAFNGNKRKLPEINDNSKAYEKMT